MPGGESVGVKEPCPEIGMTSPRIGGARGMRLEEERGW